MNVPKLRFKTDDGNEFPKWEEYKANQLFDNIVDKGHPSEIVLTIVQGTGTVPRSESGRNLQYDVEYLSNYKRVQKNDFIIHLRSFEGGLEMANEDGIVSPAYTILRSKFEIAPPFYYAYFHTNSFIHHNLAKAVEGIRDGRQISYEAFKELNIPYCSLQEQNKIAELLTALNETMEQTQSEIDAWEKQKRGVMQLLFSQKVRFKADDGSEFPEWEEKTLGDVACITMGQSPDSSSYNDKGDGELLVQGNADIQNRKTAPARWTNNPTKIAKAGDIIMSVRAPVGTVGIVLTKVCCGRGVCAINAKDNMSQSFLYQYLLSIEQKWTKEAQGGTFTAISGTDIRERKINIPVFTEQQKIAACLSGFDDVIDKTKKELEAYRELKKGLLQQMFV